MRYLGSKSSVVDVLFQLVHSRIPFGMVCDPFGGMGTVASYFKRRGYTVCTGDNLLFAHYFLVTRVQLSALPRFGSLRRFLGVQDLAAIGIYLNSLPPHFGWVTQHYSRERHFFTRENAGRIDATWKAILDWKRRSLLTGAEYAVLITSLINSADRVANTAGTYYAYLKHWYRKAVRTFKFEWLLPTPGGAGCHAHLGDAAHVASLHPVDVLYLDPPHNSRCYDDYYHLPQSIALGYQGPVRGKAGIPSRLRQLSFFYVRANAPVALSQLLKQSRWRLLILHYSDAGLISPTQVRLILSPYGHVEECEIQAKGYSTICGCRSSHRVYMVEHA